MTTTPSEPGCLGLKVLHIDSGRSLRGGQKQLLLLLEKQMEEGLEPALFCRPGPLSERASQFGIAMRTAPMRGEWDLTSAQSLANELKSNDFRLVHAHDALSHGLARLASLFGVRLPLIVHRRVDFPVRSSPLSSWKYRRGVEAYIAISEAVKARLGHAGIEQQRIFVVPSSVDFEELDRDSREPLPESVHTKTSGEKRICCIGTLEEQKGQRLLLTCAAELREKHPSLTLLFLGDGPDRENLERISGQLNLSRRCNLAGHVEPVAPALLTADCVIIPSYSEGFCTSAAQAMGLGLPVVASATGGLREIITSGVTGLLFSPGSIDELTLALDRLLSEPRLGEHLGKRAREEVRSRYTPVAMTEGIIEVYRAILSEK